MINLTKVDNFPELTRTGRVSNELQQIIDALVQSSSNGDRYALTGIEAGKAYNSMQQRIRAQAKKLNLKVVIRFDADEKKLYFKATGSNSNASVKTENEVKASDVKSIKTQTAKTGTK
jgi:hypothetical protein